GGGRSRPTELGILEGHRPRARGDTRTTETYVAHVVSREKRHKHKYIDAMPVVQGTDCWWYLERKAARSFCIATALHKRREGLATQEPSLATNAVVSVIVPV